MHWFRKHPLPGTVLILLLLGGGYFGWHFLAITYHRHQMKSAYAQISSRPGARGEYEQHCAALIQSGYFVKHQFYLKRITTSSPEFRGLLNGLQVRFPNEIGKVEGHGYIYGEPTFLIVWMHSTAAKQVGDFIEAQDAK